jgi:hypothetical protein
MCFQDFGKLLYFFWDEKKQLSPFVDARGCPVAQIANDSLLRRFLGKNWLEKSKVLAGSPGLSIERVNLLPLSLGPS